MSTRETAFVAVVCVIAARLKIGVDRNADGQTTISIWRSLIALQRDWIVLALAFVSTATYLVLHVIFREHHKNQLFQHVHQHWQFATVAGLVLAVMSYGALRVALRASRHDANYRGRRRVLWLLSLPYLVVCVRYGLWNEAPRLLFPLVLGEFLLAVSSKAPTPSIRTTGILGFTVTNGHGDA